MESLLGRKRLYISNLQDIENYMKQDLTRYEKGEVCLDLEIKEFTDEICENIAYLLEKCYFECDGANLAISLISTKNDFMFTEQEWVNIFNLESTVKEYGLMCFYDIFSYYEPSKVVNAYQSIKAIVDFIKSKTDSPLERFMMAYDYVSTFVYQSNKEDFGSARSLVQILNSFDIVCVGFADLLCCVCKELDIKVLSQDCKVGKVNHCNHRNNLVFIDDDKYNVHGVFHSDSCWDSLQPNKEPMQYYNFFLLPLTDMKHFDEPFAMDSASKYIYDDYSKEEMYSLIVSINDYDSPLTFFDLDKTKSFYDIICDEERIKNAQSVEFHSKIEKASQKLADIMKRCGIKNDDYADVDYAPAKHIPVILLTLLIDSMKNETLVESYVKEFKKMKTHKQSYDYNQKGMNIVIGYMKAFDIYRYLEDIEKSRSSSLKDIDLYNFYINYEQVKQLEKIFNEYKNSSKAISLGTIKKVLVEVRKYMGMNEKVAEIKTNQAIQKTTKYAKKVFKNTATNCFSCNDTDGLANKKGKS